jgi:mono/diheme cytochrome c family protein
LFADVGKERGMRYVSILGVLFVMSVVIAGRQAPRQTPYPADYIPSGAVLYSQTCASCHGADAKGHGPVASSLKTPPPDLTTLTRRHGGQFPYDYVTSVLLLGTNVPSHGSSDMPVWGPIFSFLDKNNKQAVLKRVKNLSDYLRSLQQK